MWIINCGIVVLLLLFIAFFVLDIRIKWIDNLSKPKLFAIIIVIILGVLVVVGLVTSGDKTLAQFDKDAFVFAKIVVKSKLKSPSTAEFQNYDPKLVRRFGDTYIIRSYVEAENSFGAMVRTYYEIELVQTKEGYSIIGLDMQE